MDFEWFIYLSYRSTQEFVDMSVQLCEIGIILIDFFLEFFGYECNNPRTNIETTRYQGLHSDPKAINILMIFHIC